MNDTLMRQWAMLRAIPRYPRRVDAPSIHAILDGLGMAVSLRTVQRDLKTLATTFPLDFDESKPQGWCWREGVGQLEIPSMPGFWPCTALKLLDYWRREPSNPPLLTSMNSSCGSSAYGSARPH